MKFCLNRRPKAKWVLGPGNFHLIDWQENTIYVNWMPCFWFNKSTRIMKKESNNSRNEEEEEKKNGKCKTTIKVLLDIAGIRETHNIILRTL